MNGVYIIRSYLETLEDYNAGLEEFLYADFAQKVVALSGEHKWGDEDDMTIVNYRLTKEEQRGIVDEMTRVRLLIGVLTNLTN